jgi:ubiquinone/menaquinone biosynthesis C-methylase UbiE
MPFENNSFYVVCAFQMLEHLPFEKSLRAFAEMDRVAKNAVVISLPDSEPRLRIAINISQFKLGCFYLPLPRLYRPIHKIEGEHYWEINKVDYSLKHVISLLQKNTKKNLINTFRVDENPYHRFFIWR